MADKQQTAFRGISFLTLSFRYSNFFAFFYTTVLPTTCIIVYDRTTTCVLA